MLETMYPAAANSRQTELAAAINDTQTSFTVLDGSVLPPGPNQLTLGTDESAETILYTGKSGNEVTGVTRGFEGVAKSWVAGTKLARYFTAYDHDTFRDNITDLDRRLNNIPEPEDASLTQKGITQLSNAIESDEDGEAATPKAVNTVRQLVASQIGDLAELQTIDKDNLVDALNEVFTHVDEGKELVKTAVIVKGGTVAGTSPHSFEELADGIDTIETSTVINGQQQVARTYAETIAANDPIYTSTDYTSIPIAEAPTGDGQGVAYSGDGVYLAFAQASSPYLSLYKRVGEDYIKLPNPTSMPTNVARAVSFTPDGVYLAVGHATSPFVTLYKRTGDVFTKLPNLSPLPTDETKAVSFSANGLYLAVGGLNTSTFNLYKRNGDSFTRLAITTGLPTNALVYSVAFGVDDDYLTIGYLTAPFIAIYKRTGDVFTKLPDPSIPPTGGVCGLDFSPNGVYLAAAHFTAPFLTLYKRNGDVFEKLPNPLVLPTNQGRAVRFNPTSEYLTVCFASLINYKLANDIFSGLPNPQFVPAQTTFSAAYTPDGSNLAIAHQGGNRLLIYNVQYDQVYKSSNLGTDLLTYRTGIGYALESGVAGDTKDVIIIWR
ncbi:tail fiber protein [Paenibacillus sp. FSL R5-0341]|uniref:tail fiber protein n=1 Tax=Paenibacillus sp. FSL R5-0341 TaxID=2921636 RepID=UPI0030D341E5